MKNTEKINIINIMYKHLKVHLNNFLNKKTLPKLQQQHSV